MRVLITGATGFVGGFLAAEIARHEPEAEIWGVGHGHPPVDPKTLPAGMRVLDGDLSGGDFVREAIAQSQPDRVYHLAGFASGAGTDRERIFRVNVDATETLLRVLAEAGRPCDVLLASSGYVYGATQPGRPARETDVATPMGAYAESKAAMERMAETLAAADDLVKVTATRAFNHTGPHQTTGFAVPAFASQIARIEAGLEEPVVRVGNLDALRDFLDVRDVVRAYRLLLTGAHDSAYRVVNVASGVGVVMRDLLDRLIAMARVPVTVETDPARLRPSDIPESVGDPGLLTEWTGWGPEISLDTTLAFTLDWWRELSAREALKAAAG